MSSMQGSGKAPAEQPDPDLSTTVTDYRAIAFTPDGVVVGGELVLPVRPRSPRLSTVLPEGVSTAAGGGSIQAVRVNVFT